MEVTLVDVKCAEHVALCSILGLTQEEMLVSVDMEREIHVRGRHHLIGSREHWVSVDLDRVDVLLRESVDARASIIRDLWRLYARFMVSAASDVSHSWIIHESPQKLWSRVERQPQELILSGFLREPQMWILTTHRVLAGAHDDWSELRPARRDT